MKQTEILDVVDDNNIVIDQKSKNEVHRLNLKHRTSHIFVVNNLNQIFMQLRAKNKKQFPSKWDISAAGHLDSGESYIEGAKRELFEELNIDLPFEKFIEIGSLDAKEENGFEFVKIYKVNYSGPIKLLYEEVETGAWFDIKILDKWIKDFPENFAGGFKEIFEIYLEGIEK